MTPKEINIRRHRNELIAETHRLDAELSDLNSQARGYRLPQADYKRICARQNVIKSRLSEIKCDLIDLRIRLQDELTRQDEEAKALKAERAASRTGSCEDRLRLVTEKLCILRHEAVAASAWGGSQSPEFRQATQVSISRLDEIIQVATSGKANE